MHGGVSWVWMVCERCVGDQVRAAGSSPNQLGQARRGLAEWLDLDPSCVEMSVNSASNAGVPGLPATIRITVPSMPNAVPIGLASRWPLLQQRIQCMSCLFIEISQSAQIQIQYCTA